MQITVRNSRFSSWNELRRANLILLGSSRINSFLASLQDGNNFVIDENEIRNHQPLPMEEPSYRGKRCLDGRLEKLVEYAVVTRQPGLVPGTVHTLITANHGRAIEGAAHFLTIEENVAALVDRIAPGGAGDLPEHVQFLLRVDMVDFDEEVIHVEPVAHRVL